MDELLEDLLAEARDENDALRAALILARARIVYLGVACADYRHFVANGETFLPQIDAALSKGKN
jgi:hypothetical protein